jgi:hypothetical protein
MILTASEVASLSKWLSFWEYGEYISEALVALACFGEYTASFTTWFTNGDRERQRRLEKCSTLLLIFSVTSGLLCLIQTNELSGRVIGYLGEQAEEAAKKSENAITEANSATDKARTAKYIAAEAELAAGHANTLAVGATELAAKADQKTQSVVNRLAWRRITSTQHPKFVTALKPYQGSVVELIKLSDFEAGTFADDILSVLYDAGWRWSLNVIGTPSQITIGALPGTLPGTYGLRCVVNDTSPAGEALHSVMQAIPCVSIKSDPDLRFIGSMFVGLKPPP